MGEPGRLLTLHDYVRHGANLRAICRCGRFHVFDAARFARYATIRAWDPSLIAIGPRVKCRICGRRPRLRVTTDPPSPRDPFPKTEDDWKRLARRMRD